MKSFVVALSFVASATTVVGHSTFQELWTNGFDQASTCARLPTSNNPVTSATAADIRYGLGSQPMAGMCTVAAGQNLTVEMHAQPGDRVCTTQALGGNHYGPVLVYMSKVTDSKKDLGSSWVKVDQEGYNTATKKWGTDTLNDNCGKRSFKVPATLAPGNYLVRAEAIALHTASQVGGAQFYITCFQTTVTGSGTANPSGVALPGAYKATDPGILIDIYQTITNYVIPGPAVWTG